MSETVLILGSVSAMARSAAAAFASRGYTIYLAGKNQQALDRMAQDVRAAHNVSVYTGVFDTQDYASHERLMREVLATTGNLAGVVLALGYVGDSERVEYVPEAAVEVINRNFTGEVSILTRVVAHLRQAGRGFVVATTCIEGDHGQVPNYVYLAARQGLGTFLDGLRRRFADEGLRVVTIRPAAPESLGSLRAGLFLTANTSSVGKRVLNALDHGVDTIFVTASLTEVVTAVRRLPTKLKRRWQGSRP